MANRKPSARQLTVARTKRAALDTARQKASALMLSDCPPNDFIGVWEKHLTKRAQGDDLARVGAWKKASAAMSEFDSECVYKGLAWRSPIMGFTFYNEQEL